MTSTTTTTSSSSSEGINNNNNQLRRRNNNNNSNNNTVSREEEEEEESYCYTELPWISPSGKFRVENSPIPQRKQLIVNDDDSDELSSSKSRWSEVSCCLDPDEVTMPSMEVTSGDAVKNDENKFQKIMIRAISGAIMMLFFVGCILSGHIYVCLLVAFVEFLLFRELVRVRYNAFFHTIQDTIPLFRTTQWLWFAVAILYTYGDFLSEVITSNQDLHHLQAYSRYFTSISFVLYSGTFVLTIATMQMGHIKFQLNQLSWTMMVLCLTVGQLKYIMHNIFNGLFWFVMPVLLVVTNDVMAYVCGMSCGRKFIHFTFIPFSPNKTWEGFIGGAFFTMICTWYLSRALAQYEWMTCPTNEFTMNHNLSCDLHPIFQNAQYRFVEPQLLLQFLPKSFVTRIPGVMQMCYSTEDSTELITQCASSSSESGEHHHFEFVLNDIYPVQLHALALSMFASLVAPFGGFLASAIKRAYGIKDFDSIIPGHGGVMDRLDCQLLMALCVWVYYNTFIKMGSLSVPKLVYMYNMLSPQEKVDFMKAIEVTGGDFL